MLVEAFDDTGLIVEPWPYSREEFAVAGPGSFVYEEVIKRAFKGYLESRGKNQKPRIMSGTSKFAYCKRHASRNDIRSITNWYEEVSRELNELYTSGNQWWM